MSLISVHVLFMDLSYRKTCTCAWNKIVLCAQLLQPCLTLCDPMDCSPPVSSVHGIFFRQECWSGVLFPPLRDHQDPGIESASPALAGKFFTTEPPGHSGWKKVKNVFSTFILSVYIQPEKNRCSGENMTFRDC